MHPKLQQDVIGFERGVGCQQRAPVAIGMLQRKEMLGRERNLLLCGGEERVSDLERSAYLYR